MINKIVIKLIKIYQFLLSPLLGRQCRFYPTCSHYAISAFEQHRFFTASYLTLYRLWRCQPLYHGGVDLVPQKCPTKEYHHGL